MRKLLALSMVAFLGVSAFGCAKADPELNKLAVTTASSASGSSSAIRIKENQAWASDADSDTATELRKVTGDAMRGTNVDEGGAGVVSVLPLFDDGDRYDGIHALSGALHVAASTPDVAELQPLPNEDRRFVLVGKKAGHADFTFTIDGTPGSVVMGVDVVAQTP